MRATEPQSIHMQDHGEDRMQKAERRGRNPENLDFGSPLFHRRSCRCSHRSAIWLIRGIGALASVADLFKYRNNYGLDSDSALGALRDVLRGRNCTVDELMRFARIRHVVKIIEPDLTADLAS